jgi:enoyl-CoA hydratase
VLATRPAVGLYATIIRCEPQVYAWAKNPTAKAILLKSSSERAFCSGGDVKALALALAEDPASQLPAQALAAEYSLLLALRSSPLPTIAGHLHALGGACS